MNLKQILKVYVLEMSKTYTAAYLINELQYCKVNLYSSYLNHLSEVQC
jgi:hypothetical protein